MDAFAAGYSFFEKNTGNYTAACMGDYYVSLVRNEIDSLVSDLNTFCGDKTKVSFLKGDIAEFWHSGTFNINAVARSSASRTYVDRSHELGSADISSNFGKEFGLKYYKTGEASAKEQSKSFFERYMEYLRKGGKDTYEEYLLKKGYIAPQSIRNEPLYGSQQRIIPKDQLADGKAWLDHKIKSERSKRSEQVHRYQDTLDKLNDKIEDGKGTSSIGLSEKESKVLTRLAKEGKISAEILKDFGVSTEDLIRYEYILRESFKSGTTAATISIVLNIAPEIYKAISFLIKNGELDEQQFREIGFAALQGGAEGFVRGTISAAITTTCKAGLLGDALKTIDPSIIAVITVIAMDTMKNAFKVATGTMEGRELVRELTRDVFISTCSMIGGGISQAFIELPVLGFMLGSFVGSVVGSFAYDVGCNAILSFCVDTGFTMFGLVDQNYELPDEVLEEIGIELFQYEQLNYNQFQYNEFSFKEFTYLQSQPDTLSIGILRRGVIGVAQIGYL